MENNNTLLNRMFSRKMLSDIIKTNYSEIYSSVISRYIASPENKTNRQLISEIYNILRNDYRNEYFYKNTILNQLLIKVHKIETTIALTEIPIANSIVDILMINGKPKVYEIKTELDNFSKLEGQLYDYFKAFEYVSVVTAETNVEKLQLFLKSLKDCSFYKFVGIYFIDKNSNIQMVQEPQSFKDLLDKHTMFKILRKKEYEKILQNQGIVLPNVSQFEYYSECLKLFQNIPLDIAYNEFFTLLKSRSIIEKERLVKIPEELREVVYFSNIKEKEYDEIYNFLNLIYDYKKESA